MRSGIAIFFGAAALILYGVYRVNRSAPSAPPAAQPVPASFGAGIAPMANRGPSRLTAQSPTAKEKLAPSSIASQTALPPLTRQAFAPIWEERQGGPQLPERMLHDRLQGEQMDANWSPNVAANLTAYLQNAPSGAAVDVLGVDCRAATCEVLTASKAADPQSMEQFQSDIFTARQQSWWTGYGLKDVSFAVTTTDDGRWAAVTYFTTSRIKYPPP